MKNDPRERRDGPPIWSLALVFVGGMLLLSFGVYVWTLGSTGTIEPVWAGVGALGAVAVGTWLWMWRAHLKSASDSGGASFAAMALSLTAIALGIAVAANVLAVRFDQRWDLTSSQRFTLSEQTISVLDGLDQDIIVLAFFPSGAEDQLDFKDIIAGYQSRSPHIKVEHHDPVREPFLAEQNEITSQWGTVIFKAGSATQRLESTYDEESITNALVRVTSGVEHIVCFSEGHGEVDPDDGYDPMGLGAAVERLKGQNYTTRKVTLAREGVVPADCEILVAADPQHDWLPAERELLAAYVAGGGNFVLLLEPGHAPELAADMGRYGLEVGDDLILESGPNAQVFGGDITYLLLSQDSFDFHPITSALSAYTMHRIVRSVSKGVEREGLQVQELAHTTTDSWAKTDLDNLTDITPDPTTDRLGPIPMMAAVEVTDPAVIEVNLLSAAPADSAAAVQVAMSGEAQQPPTAAAAEVTRAPGGKLVVIGDVDFATNQLLDQGNNLDLLLNTLAWMAGEEDQLSIRPNEAAEVGISMGDLQAILIWLLCVLVAPGLTLLGAVLTWMGRRRK